MSIRTMLMLTILRMYQWLMPLMSIRTDFRLILKALRSIKRQFRLIRIIRPVRR